VNVHYKYSQQQAHLLNYAFGYYTNRPSGVVAKPRLSHTGPYCIMNGPIALPPNGCIGSVPPVEVGLSDMSRYVEQGCVCRVSSKGACVVCRARVRVSSTGACVEHGRVCRARTRVSSIGACVEHRCVCRA
jgi:hypothetical protein